MTDRWQEFFDGMKAIGLTPIVLDDPATVEQKLEQASQAARKATMQIEVTEEQARAIRLVGWFITCVDAANMVDTEPRIDDTTPLLHFVSHGATAIVTAGDMRALASIATPGVERA